MERYAHEGRGPCRGVDMPIISHPLLCSSQDREGDLVRLSKSVPGLLRRRRCCGTPRSFSLGSGKGTCLGLTLPVKGHELEGRLCRPPRVPHSQRRERSHLPAAGCHPWQKGGSYGCDGQASHCSHHTQRGALHLGLQQGRPPGIPCRGHPANPAQVGPHCSDVHVMACNPTQAIPDCHRSCARQRLL